MTFDVFTHFATDESLEDNGTWFNLGGDAKLLVARMGNTRYAEMLGKEFERNRKALELDDEAAKQLNEQLMLGVLASTVLVGWENVSYKGKPMPYSVENAKTLLSHKDFRRQVLRFSEDIDAYRAKLEEVQGEA